MYAPKDDLKHRALWREPYSTAEAGALAELIRACARRRIRFVYALSPGLDIRFSHPADLECLKNRIAQLLARGCCDFALLFDDIPDRMRAADARRFGSFASAQCHVANAMFRWLRARVPSARFLFCPTAYCGRMAERGVGGRDYLATVGRELLPEIEVFWTGPEIISREISVEHVRGVREVLRRKPVIWDNLHANDYDGRRFFCGPYAGRAPALRGEVAGLLSNPNCEFALNYVPLRTLGEFVRGGRGWNARRAWRAAMRAWWPRFAVVGPSVTLGDLLRFGDCYYLPHEEGPEAEALYRGARQLLEREPSEWGREVAQFRQRAARLRRFCERLAGLRDRR
ncbi:MAG: beta-N-acetylglucosaminidase domain-containing protein, partial [Verrucomicrobiales bacterium]|nr:beta-N-acetylglucosaminidase domain-containing protein [Verrucomicrobiales bacterium]